MGEVGARVDELGHSGKEAQKEKVNWLHEAQRQNCSHAHFLSFTPGGRCEGCRKSPLSRSLPDPHNPHWPVPPSTEIPE
jgi:hypothetical protein